MLSLVFGPDTVSTANLMTDLARGLQEMGHQVTVSTSMPHYNPSKSVLANPAYRRRPPTVYAENKEAGVRVFRVYMPLKGRRLWRRVLDYGWFHLATTLVAGLKAGKQDVIFVPSPPITLGLSGWALTLVLGGKLIYNVQELWPDVPVRMGLLRSPILVRLVYSVESFVYRRSHAIASIARSFNETLAARGVPQEKLHFTPNFVDVDWLRLGNRDNDFAREQRLLDKFVVLYAGNIGLTQGLETLVKVGLELQGEDDIEIVVVGDGAGRASFEQAVDSSGLKNVRLLPFQPYNVVPQIYAAANVCVSPMRFGFSYDTIPSKINTAMAMSRPVVAACEADTETARILTESGAGIIVTPESAAEMAAAIRALRESPKLAAGMGQNARRWVVQHCSKDAVIATYDRIIAEVVRGHS